MKQTNDRFEFEEGQTSGNKRTVDPTAIHWFFDIYIQKVNTTLKVESGIRMRIPVIINNFPWHLPRGLDWSSYKEHMMDALVPTGDEGRDKLR
jgi:hypothetical protein